MLDEEPNYDKAFPKLIPWEFKDLIHAAKAGVIVMFKIFLHSHSLVD